VIAATRVYPRFPLLIYGREGVRRFESVRGLCEVAANQPLLFAVMAAVCDLDVHQRPPSARPPSADRYLALWNEPDADRRRRMIAELWTEDGAHILQPPQEIREIAARPRKLYSLQATKDGVFMEPGGRNPWQPVANGTAARTAQTGENRCRGLRPVA
jgi:hypothetical protein